VSDAHELNYAGILLAPDPTSCTRKLMRPKASGRNLGMPRRRLYALLLLITVAAFTVGTLSFFPIQCTHGISTPDAALIAGEQPTYYSRCTGIIPIVLPGFYHSGTGNTDPSYAAALVVGAVRF